MIYRNRISRLLSLLVVSACTLGVHNCVSAQTEVPKQEASIAPKTVTFRPMDQIEQRYIYRSLGSQEIPSERTRFQDKTAYIIYRFAFVPGSTASLRMQVTAQFQVDLSDDGQTYRTVALYTKDKGDPLVVDLTPYTSRGLVYIRVGDAKPDDGWGGKIHEISVTGSLREVHNGRIGNVTPRFPHDRAGLYAKLPLPSRHLYHFDAINASNTELILFRTLQGLVNRDKNQLIIGDHQWRMIPELKKRHWVDRVTEIPDSAGLFRQFPKRDAVVYDPHLYGSENLAVMIGSMEGLVVAHPSLVTRYHLHVKQDLRGRWKRTIDGYKDVYARYHGRFNQQTLVLAAPTKRPALYDYAMAHRTFTFWIVGGTDADRRGADRWAEEDWFEKTLTSDFPVNIPILGYPQVEPEDGIGENRGVELFSRCGKFLIPADHMPNLSLFTAYPNAHNEIKVPYPPKKTLDPARVYVSMVLSDGDNQCLWNGPTAFMFQYMRQMKAAGPRDFSVSYTMGPSIVDLNPLAAAMVNQYLEPQDSIGGAVSGVGYMYMSQYANNFGKAREQVIQDFNRLTSDYLGYAGERWDWIMDYGGPGSDRLKDYSGLRGCVALVGGYGQETTDPHKTSEQVGSMAVFHSVTRMVEMDGVLSDVKHVVDTGVRPLFLHVFISNWSVNPQHYREIAESLIKSGMEIVTPETLADLYRQSTRH